MHCQRLISSISIDLRRCMVNIIKDEETYLDISRKKILFFGEKHTKLLKSCNGKARDMLKYSKFYNYI